MYCIATVGSPTGARRSNAKQVLSESRLSAQRECAQVGQDGQHCPQHQRAQHVPRSAAMRQAVLSGV
jgi:hypothetical protein